MAPHRPTLFNLMNSIVGVSLLSIPYCFHQCGVILGPLAMLTMGYFTKKTCSFLLVSSQLRRRRSYESLAQSTYGNTGKFFIEACIIGLMAGTLCAFNVIIGDLAPSLISNLFDIKETPTLRAVVMMIVIISIGLPLSLMRDISSLSSISAVSLGFYATFVLHIFLGSLPHLLEGNWIKNVNFWRPSGLLQSLPIFSLAFSCQTQLFGLYDSLPDPSVKKMESVVALGIRIVACVYLCVGCFGYILFYDVGVKGDILTNYGSSSAADLIKSGFVMSVIVSFPLMVFPMRASINSLLFPSQTAGTENMPGGPGYMPQNRFVLITVVVICSTLMVGIFIPQIEFVLGLTGATIGTLIIIVLPAAMYLHATQDSQVDQRILAKVTVVFGLICLIASTYSVLQARSHGHHESNDLPVIKPTFLTRTLPNVSASVGPIQYPNTGELKATAEVESKQVDVRSPTQKPYDRKTENPNDGKKKIDEIREKAAQRKEPALPHAPDEKEDGAMIKKEKMADPLNEKRQLMSTDDASQQRDVDGKDAKTPTPSSDASTIETTKEEIVQKAKKLQEKQTEVELDSKDVNVFKKYDSRERRNLKEEPAENKKRIVKKNDGLNESTPTKKVSATVISFNDTSLHIVGPNSSANITAMEGILTEGTIAPKITNFTSEALEGRDLKSNGAMIRTLKSESLVKKDISKVDNAFGYSKLWRKKLAVERNNKLNKVGRS